MDPRLPRHQWLFCQMQHGHLQVEARRLESLTSLSRLFPGFWPEVHAHLNLSAPRSVFLSTVESSGCYCLSARPRPKSFQPLFQRPRSSELCLQPVQKWVGYSLHSHNPPHRLPVLPAFVDPPETLSTQFLHWEIVVLTAFHCVLPADSRLISESQPQCFVPVVLLWFLQQRFAVVPVSGSQSD